MTRKDYVAIARILREAQEHIGVIHDLDATSLERATRKTMANDITEEFAIYLKTDNPRFDREHFLAVVRGERDLNSRPPRKTDNPIRFCLHQPHNSDVMQTVCEKCGKEIYYSAFSNKWVREYPDSLGRNDSEG